MSNIQRSFPILFILFQFSFLLAQQKKPIGINLAGIADWSEEFVFTDAFKQSRLWTPHNADGSGAWDSGVDIPLDAQGYPLEIPFNDGVHPPQTVRALMIWDLFDATPKGKYRLIAEGNGIIELEFGASGRFQTPIDTLVEVTGAVSLRIVKSNSTNPIHKVKFIYPKYVENFQDKEFSDELLEFLKDFKFIRFMDWLRTNNSFASTWSERSTYDYYTQSTYKGASWELIISLANTAKKDIWINIPHGVDDEYIEKLAQLMHQKLNPTLNIYLEYSNEVWNGIFSQYRESARYAEELGFTGSEWERAWKYTAKRSADIFRIFESVFGSGARLIKIVPSQAANPWLSNQILQYFQDPQYNPTLVKASALAIAPYFGGNTANDIFNEGLIQTISSEDIINRMRETLPQCYNWMIDSKTVADKFNLRLVCYEGGQHLVATYPAIDNDILTEKLKTANTDPMMQDLYCEYLDYWYEHIGGAFCHFSSHGKYTKYGSWGIKRNFEDVENPKYLALQKCVFEDNLVDTKTTSIEPYSFFYPNPSSDEIYIVRKTHTDKIRIFDLLGGLHLESSEDCIDISHLPKGTYMIQLLDCVLKFVKI